MKSILAILALVLFLPCVSFAGQLTSDFRGKVVDGQGQAVPGAVMVLEAVETGRVTRHVSGSTGRWHATNVRSDLTYRVSCYAPGSATPAVRFEGRASLGQVHVRNCVLGSIGPESPSWLFSWSWRQQPGDRFVLAGR